MNASDLKHRLAGSALAVCKYLYPAGRVEGNEYRLGGTDGSPGKPGGGSMKIHLSGQKAGVWSDFGTGEGGDLIDLWRAAKGMEMLDALDDIRGWLGVERPNFHRQGDKPRKTFKKPPTVENTKPADDSYLGSRGISEQTIRRLKIRQRGRTLYFPFIEPGAEKASLVKWRDTDTRETSPTGKGQKPILFGWQAADPNARECWIVEGEIDSASGYEMGIPVCLSVPFGGGAKNKQGQWIENEYDNLDRFETINIATDMDEEGDLAAQEIVNRLGAHRCVRVQLPKKDLNECLQAGLTAWQSFPIAQYDPKELKRPGDFREEILRDLFPTDDEAGILLPWQKFKNKLAWRPAELIVVNGINGHGKSQWLGHVLIDIRNQEYTTADGEILPYQVCIYSGELKPGRLFSRMVRQVNASDERPTLDRANLCIDWLDEGFLVFDLTGSAKADRLLEVFEYAYRRYGVRHFAIDSLMKCGIGVDDYNGQKKFIEQLCDFKNKFDVTIFLVTHPRKVSDEKEKSGKMDVKGDSSITDLPDTVLSVWRNKPKEDHIETALEAGDEPQQDWVDDADAYISCVKQRNGEWEGNIGLYFDRPSLQYLNNEQDDLFPYVPGGSR